MPKRKRNKQPKLDPSSAHISIVGSGLAGLAAAIALEQANFSHIHIFERDSSLSARKEGYGMTLTYDATALRVLGVTDRLADEECPSRSHYLFVNKAVRGYFGNAFCIEAKGERRGFCQRGNIRVPRQSVRRILAEQLKVTTVHWNHRLVGVRQQQGDNKRLLLHFADQQQQPVATDFVIAADGIRSPTTRFCLNNQKMPPLRPLGIRLILGLTRDFSYPSLLHERGFYTLHNRMRLFVMPYSAPKPFNQETQAVPLRYMWQLSFPCTTYSSEASEQQQLDGTILQQEALQRTKDWHTPVPAMIAATPVSDIWGTVLYDRDPTALQQALLEDSSSYFPFVIPIGDALHAMSPFKGQGANQALQDGLTVVKCLCQSSTPAKVALREIVTRTAPVVQASREAAMYWHSDECCANVEKQQWMGVPPSISAVLSRELDEQGITAETVTDKLVGAVINELLTKQHDGSSLSSMSTTKGETPSSKAKPIDSSTIQTALTAARVGDRGTLRRMSRTVALAQIPGLVVAAGECVRTVHWLETEAGCTKEVRKVG